MGKWPATRPIHFEKSEQFRGYLMYDKSIGNAISSMKVHELMLV